MTHKAVRRYFKRTLRVKPMAGAFCLVAGYWVPSGHFMRRDRWNTVRVLATGSKCECEAAITREGKWN
jgi:hypothetical protein